MGKIIKFILKAFLYLFLLGIVLGLAEEFSGVLLAVVAIGAIVVVIAKKSSNQSSQSNLETKQEPPKPIATPAPEPAKRAEDDRMEKLHVDMED